MSLKTTARLTLTLLCASLLALTLGCSTTSKTTPITATPAPDCAAWPVISYSAKQDSPETIRQIIASNAARKAVCSASASAEAPPAPSPEDDWFGVSCGLPCVIHQSYGGYIEAFTQQADLLRRANVPVIVDGPCVSACTVLLDIDRANVCLTNRAELGYHQAAYSDSDGKQHDVMLHFDTPGLDAYLTAHGGLPAQPGILVLEFAQAKQFYRPCAGAVV